MSPIVGYIIVIAALATICGLAIRSLVKSHKKGGCNGDCCNCSKCH